MKIYVVLEIGNYTDYIYCGVYKTFEKANDRVDELINEFGKDEDSLYIQEEELE